MSQVSNFKDLGLAKTLLNTLQKLRYETPSPIQARAIPEVIAGNDVMAAAQTGTGKTAGFTLPILHRLVTTDRPKHKGNQARVLVLVPTRELAAQVADSVRQYGENLRVKSVVVFGGVSINPQMQKLRGGADVLIATPGRLLDLHSKNAIQFDRLEALVLDEADRMLDMGFIHDIKKIIQLLPKRRQTLMFSATFSNDVRQLARSLVKKPVEISVTPPNSTVKAVKQSLIAVEKNDKRKILTRLIKEHDWYQVLVFSRTKHGADRLAKQLTAQNIQAMAIHGNKTQGARTKALAAFKSGKLRVLVATDIAARGIDIDALPQVVNFDLPHVAEDYVHRIGRTGRAGASGQALSLVSHDEYKQLVEIERLIKKAIPRLELDGYEPLNALRASKLNAPAKNFKKESQDKIKKPRKKPKKKANKKPNRNASAKKKSANKAHAKTGEKGNQNRHQGNKTPNKNSKKRSKRPRPKHLG